MRLAITLGFPHTGDLPVTVCGPEVPIEDQRRKLKEASASRTNADFRKLVHFELDESQSRSRHFKPAAVNDGEPVHKPARKPKNP